MAKKVLGGRYLFGLTLYSSSQISQVDINCTYVRVRAANSHDVVKFIAAVLPTPQNALTLHTAHHHPVSSPLTAAFEDFFLLSSFLLYTFINSDFDVSW